MLQAQGLATRHDVGWRALPGALEAASKTADYIHSQAGGSDVLLCRACTKKKEAERLSPYRTQEMRLKD